MPSAKGMSVFLISQSPDDFDTVEDNFLDQIGLTACFRSNGTSPRVLRACLDPCCGSGRLTGWSGRNPASRSTQHHSHQGMGVMPPAGNLSTLILRR